MTNPIKAAGDLSPEDQFERYLANAIDRAPEPLRRLGEWLSHHLDEDDWKTAERFVLGAMESLAHPVSPQAETASAKKVEEAAVVAAAREWTSERTVNDWAEGDLMKAVATLDGDWEGCPDCEHDCDEPCMPHTVAEAHAFVDSRIAQLVHEGKLCAYVGYKPPEGWKPVAGPKSRRAERGGAQKDGE